MLYRYVLVTVLFTSMTHAVPEVPNWNGVPTNPHQRPSSYPFVSGDSFRSLAQHIFDETAVIFNPSSIAHADIVFVRSDVLDIYFGNYHSRIKNPYILITHNSDNRVPGIFAQFLNDPKIIAWFSTNVDQVHQKLYPIPIGLSNRNWPHGNIEVVLRIMENAPPLDRRMKKIYLNFRVFTNTTMRAALWEYFHGKDFCLVHENRSYRDYLEDMKQCQFVMSPPGNGFDCHRTWEALYMGAIPLLLHSSLDTLFNDLPVIFIDDWHAVNESFLSMEYAKLLKKECNMKKLYMDYWIALIKEVQATARKNV